MTPSEWSAHAVTTRKFPLGIRSHPSLAGWQIERVYYDSKTRGGQRKDLDIFMHTTCTETGHVNREDSVAVRGNL